ncbi:four helix bundle protein [Ekhidna sp.]|uniref:four helix bundle protein n=1 Tax=Ekhidna sp. TaxID=2608089 RepID=UPI003BAD58C6
MAFKFEKLQVWQRALELTVEIDKLIKKIPSEEKYALASQIKRAADSIVLNIAEGSTGQTNKEFSRFLGIALRSGIEVVACLHLGKKREIINMTDFNVLYNELEEIIKMIQGLRNSLK